MLALHFVAAGENGDSACSVGMARVREGKVRCAGQLIKPGDAAVADLPGDVPGIDPEDVQDAPSFEQVWPRLSDRLEGSIVLMHGADAQLSVLSSCAERYGLCVPSFRYVCTLRASGAISPELADEDLGTTAKRFGISPKGGDPAHMARACLLLGLKLTDEAGSGEIEDHIETFGGVDGSTDEDVSIALTVRSERGAGPSRAYWRLAADVERFADYVRFRKSKQKGGGRRGEAEKQSPAEYWSAVEDLCEDYDGAFEALKSTLKERWPEKDTSEWTEDDVRLMEPYRRCAENILKVRNRLKRQNPPSGCAEFHADFVTLIDMTLQDFVLELARFLNDHSGDETETLRAGEDVRTLREQFEEGREKVKQKAEGGGGVGCLSCLVLGALLALYGTL